MFFFRQSSMLILLPLITILYYFFITTLSISIHSHGGTAIIYNQVYANSISHNFIQIINQVIIQNTLSFFYSESSNYYQIG